tara:strand:+ start:5182 stop:5835 length:654 start_codon:yes stop_codon:yes gene_type:complete
MKLITEQVCDLSFITEEIGGKKSLFIEGVFLQSDVKNKNGRMYPKEVLQREVKRYNEQYVKTKRAFGELGHPDGPVINLERVSHMITGLKEDGKDFVGKAKVMTNTPYGKIVESLLEEGAQLGVSSRGMGTLKKEKGANVVQDDFYLATAADIVADPSAPNAFVEGIMEGKEWVYENGVFKEEELANLKGKLENTSRFSKDREEIILESFKHFFSKI